MLTKTQKTTLRAAYASDVWSHNEKMVDYCTNKTAALAELPGGQFIPVEKQPIEKRFCFGYHDSRYNTDSYDDANRMARHAAESTTYFKNENMAAFRKVLDILREMKSDPLPNTVAVIAEHPYYGQKPGSPLKGLSFIRDWEVIEALGGSCHTEEVPGTAITYRGSSYRVPTAEELEIILTAYEQAARDHEKKIDAYLKRYGMSKVETWSYWMDA